MPEASNKPLTTTRVAALLMLCPLLAVSDSVLNALGLGIVAMLVTVTVSIPLSVTLQRLPEYGRIATAVSIVSAVVTSATLIVNAYFHDLYLAIGAYLPLLAASGLLLARYELKSDAPSREKRTLVLAGLKLGAVFAMVLLALGAVREFVGHGSLFFGASALPIEGANRLTHIFFHPDLGFILAALPPGAFIAIGILFAIRNWIRQRAGRQ